MSRFSSLGGIVSSWRWRFAFGALLLVATTAAACTSVPYSGQQIESNKVDFTAFASLGGGRATLVPYDWQDNQFDEGRHVVLPIPRVPKYQAGEVCPDAPALYLVAGTLPLDRRQNWRRNGDQQEARMMAYEQSDWNLIQWPERSW
jgi:hypothetical protein